MGLSEKELQAFHEKRKKVIHQVCGEGVIALLPLFAFLVGVSLYSTQSNDLFAPARTGLWTVLLPLLGVVYIVFLGYLLYDIRERLKSI